MQILLVRTHWVTDDYDGKSMDDAERSTAPTLTPVEARQGVISGRVVSVLIASLALAVAAGAVLVGFYWI